MKTLKEKFYFIDEDKHRADIRLEITDRNGYEEFTVCADCIGHSGQCDDSIKPRTEHQKKLIELWNLYHLKNISLVSIEGETFFDYIIKLIANIKVEQIEYDEEQEEENKELTEDEQLLKDMEEYGIDEDMLEQCRAYLECMGSGTDLSNFEERYSGEFASDEDFAQDLAEQCGDLQENPHWPYNCIDWEFAAKEIMYDYCEQDGYYFRNC